MAIESVLEQYAIVDGALSDDLIVLRSLVTRIEAHKERRVKLRALAAELEERLLLQPRRARRERSRA
ncbi:MAG: hypothetical protein IAI48_00670 [Candidatus Eremiobacteraeota bacterium]|nr:hypothetical protein [Candidatus Eremiobacteraeota bacterium]